MGFLPKDQTEAHIYSQYLLENHPRSKVAVLYQEMVSARTTSRA